MRWQLAALACLLQLASSLVVYDVLPGPRPGVLMHMRASFGLQSGNVTGFLAPAPDDGFLCARSGNFSGRILLVKRGNCTFVDKARHAQSSGAVGLVVGNYEDAVIQMGGSASDVTIPVVMLTFPSYTYLERLSSNSSAPLLASVNQVGEMDLFPDDWYLSLRLAAYLLLVLPALWVTLAALWALRYWCRTRVGRRVRASLASRIPVVPYQSPRKEREREREAPPDVAATAPLTSPSSPSSSSSSLPPGGIGILSDGCAICIEDFSEGERVKALPCHHAFHPRCIDQSLERLAATCPVCRTQINEADLPNPSLCSQTCSQCTCLCV